MKTKLLSATFILCAANLACPGGNLRGNFVRFFLRACAEVGVVSDKLAAHRFHFITGFG